MNCFVRTNEFNHILNWKLKLGMPKHNEESKTIDFVGFLIAHFFA
jgi:hypothetical protein